MDPRQRKAGAIVLQAVIDGKLPHPRTLRCKDCAHWAKLYDHRDYDKPLKVEPVCWRCNKLRGPEGPRRMPVKNPRKIAAREKPIHTSTMIDKAGGTMQALADLLGISRQAVHRWGPLVPEMRVYQLRALRPSWFTSKKPSPFPTAGRS